MNTEKISIIIVGGGKGGTALLEVLHSHELVNIKGIVDVDPEAPGIQLARKLGIPTGADWKTFVDDTVDEIIDVSGNKKVNEALLREKPEHIDLLGGPSAKMMWLLFEESIRSNETLNKRVNEQACLYNISKLLEKRGNKIEDILRNTAELLPPACSFPEAACGRITLEKRHFQTKNFMETPWVLTSPIIVENERVGHVEVRYLEEKPLADEGPFSKEERNLIDAIAERLGRVIEQIRANQEIKESKDHAELIYRVVPSAIFTVDRDRRIISWNNKAAEITGYNADEVMGQECFLFAEMPCKGKCGLFAEDVQKPIVGVECTIRCKDGTIRTISKSVDILHSPDGMIIGGIESFVDITERKQAAEAIEREKNFLRSVVESLTYPFYVIDPETYQIQLANTVAKELGAAEGKTCYKVTHKRDEPCDGSDHPCPLAEVKKTGKPSTVEHIHRDKDGNPINAEVHAFPIFDGKGKLINVIEYSIDITERKRAEIALQQTAREWQTTFDSIPDLVSIQDKNFKLLRVNKAYIDLLGMKEEDIIGKTCHKLVHDRDEPIEGCPHKRALETGKHSTKEYFEPLLGLYLEISCSPIRNEDDEVIGTVHITKNITERKQAEEALLKAKTAAEEASSAKADFLANMSHEIRTPMNGVIGMLRFLQDTSLDTQQRDYSTMALSSAESLMHIINDILDFSKIEAGKLEMEEVPFDLQLAVEEVSRLFAPRAWEKRVELLIDFPSDTPSRILGDPNRVKQILTNLMGNALKFTHQGHILISIRHEQQEDSSLLFTINIEDTGIGISKEGVRNIFQKFSQVDSSTTRKYGGTGLGLAIASQLTSMMSGKIDVTSTPEKGSTFSVRIPFKLDRHPAPPPLPMSDLRGARILIVDDNELNRRILSQQLSSPDIEYATASSATEALEKLQEAADDNKPYHIAIIDFFMPEMDGKTLGETIKSNHILKDTILVMLTSAGRHGNIKEIKKAGFAAYLAKPSRQSMLVKTLKTLWSRRDDGLTHDMLTEHALAEDTAAQQRKSGKGTSPYTARVLVAEDNYVNQRVAMGILKQFGCEVDVVPDGNAALQALEQVNYDLAFIDIQMPGMDGFEVTKRVRKREGKKQHTPLVAMTAHAMKGVREECINVGMDDYVSKPLDPKEIERILKMTVDGKSSTEKNDPEETTYREKKADSSPPVFDREAGLHTVAGSVELLRDVVGDFIDYTPKQLKELATAIKMSDKATAERLAHGSKGAAANIGAERFRQVALSIEKAAHDGDMEKAQSRFMELENELCLFQAEIKKIDWEKITQK